MDSPHDQLLMIESPFAKPTAEGIYRINRDGLCTFANHACTRMLGFSDPRGLLGKRIHDLILHTCVEGGTFAAREHPIESAIRTGQSTHADDQVFWRADGSCFYVEYWTFPEMVQGECVGCIVNFLDISKRKAAMQQLHSRELQLSMALEAGRMGLWEWDIANDQVHWSDHLYEIFGQDRSQFQTNRAGFFRVVHPEDRNKLEHMIHSAFHGNCTRHEVKFRVIRGDNGQTVWTHCRGIVIRGADGTPIRIMSLASDVTQERKDADELETAKRNLEIAMSVAQFGVGYIDYHSDIAELSAEAAVIYGLGEKRIQVSREKLHSTFHPEDRRELENCIQSQFKIGSDGKLARTHRVQHAEGSVRWISVQKQVFFESETRKPNHAILVARDITSEIENNGKLEQALQDANAANNSKSAFLANMSHEIRTPMTAILGYAELISHMELTEEAKDYLKIIRRNGAFLLDIINDILDLSKIEAGKLEVMHESFSPQRVIDDIRAIMEVRAAEKQIRLDVEYVGKIPPSILSDAKRLKQILFNLVGNAIKFTSQGEVHIRVHMATSNKKPEVASPAMLQIDVSDTGIGISEELQQHLFQPFSQVHSNLQVEYGGTGLGLAISRRLADMLGGELTVTSRSGEGSVFSLIVPTGEPTGIPFRAPSLPSDPPRSSQASTPQPLDCFVLIVDDRRDIRLLSKTILEKNGARTEEAEDGEIALRLVQERLNTAVPFDLILLDMQMPRLDGYKTARQLRDLGYGGPIIALTADAMQGDNHRCFDAGCDDYIGKPMNVERLLEMIRFYTTT